MCACLPGRLYAWLLAAALTVSVQIFQRLYIPECPLQYAGGREREGARGNYERERRDLLRLSGGQGEGERERETDRMRQEFL